MPVEEEVACLAWPRFEEPDPHPFPVAVEHAELVPCVLEAYLAASLTRVLKTSCYP